MAVELAHSPRPGDEEPSVRVTLPRSTASDSRGAGLVSIGRHREAFSASEGTRVELAHGFHVSRDITPMRGTHDRYHSGNPP